MMNLYQELVRRDYIKWYKVSLTKNRTTFSKLKKILELEEIDADDFLRVQFQCKGTRPFPNQLLSKHAINRYIKYRDLQNVEGLHHQQEVYLETFMENGYTLEESLQIPIFYYYFRCMKVKDHPKEWKIKVDKEIQSIPELKNLIREKK